MSDPEQNINRILSEAANNLRIPTQTAQVIMMIGAELLAQREMITDLATAMRQPPPPLQHLEERLSSLQKQVDRLKGVHGA